MHLHGGDVWLHAAPLFHLVDVFAVYGITLVGGRHVMLGSFSPREAIAAIGGSIGARFESDAHACLALHLLWRV